MEEMTGERLLLKMLCASEGIPKELWKFMDFLVKEGCPAVAVIKGFAKFGEFLAFKELVKDLKVELEDD